MEGNSFWADEGPLLDCDVFVVRFAGSGAASSTPAAGVAPSAAPAASCGFWLSVGSAPPAARSSPPPAAPSAFDATVAAKPSSPAPGLIVFHGSLVSIRVFLCSFCRSSSGGVSSSTTLSRIEYFAASAPLLWIFTSRVLHSPKTTLPKSMKRFWLGSLQYSSSRNSGGTAGSGGPFFFTFTFEICFACFFSSSDSSFGSKSSTVFFVRHITGKSIRPVFARIGNVVQMSMYSFGWYFRVILQETPADIRPGGSKPMSKKSRILSSMGSSLNWLKVRETLVTSITCLYFSFASKSRYSITLGDGMKLWPSKVLPQHRWTSPSSICLLCSAFAFTSIFSSSALLFGTHIFPSSRFPFSRVASPAPSFASRKPIPSSAFAASSASQCATRFFWNLSFSSTAASSSGGALPNPNAPVFTAVTFDGSMRIAFPVGSKISTWFRVTFWM
mmetsp:Transcript_26710/g.67326  ORF Transcript_26710/g.67326 Transcript_26710/m.67326 type:complete len:444 (-) Transcript_26710:1441-2772(-)